MKIKQTKLVGILLLVAAVVVGALFPTKVKNQVAKVYPNIDDLGEGSDAA